MDRSLLDRRGELLARHADQRDRLGEELQRQYGKGIEDACRTLAEVEERSQRRGIRALIYRMGGGAREDRRAAETARATLDNIEWRISEREGGLASRQRNELAEFDRARRREDRRLEDRIAALRPANRNIPREEPRKETEWQRIQRLRAELAERERAQGRDGREFERDI